MRQLHDHKINALNDAIDILVTDDPGPGGACHDYSMHVLTTPATLIQQIHFQKGPVQVSGPNGVSNEALMVVVIDRLRCFQAGEYACRENALALTKLEEALMWLQKRTRDRIARGVEGTYQK